MAVPPTITLRRLNRDYTLQVRLIVTREWRLRLQIARFLMRICAHILCCGIHFQETIRIDEGGRDDNR